MKITYNHIKCDHCKIGIIGVFERNECKCNMCGKEFTLYKLNYDRLIINDINGWIFPVIDKAVDELNDIQTTV